MSVIRFDYISRGSTGYRTCTPCPHGKDSYVGSLGCEMCKFNKGLSFDSHLVNCKYEDNKNVYSKQTLPPLADGYGRRKA